MAVKVMVELRSGRCPGTTGSLETEGGALPASCAAATDFRYSVRHSMLRERWMSSACCDWKVRLQKAQALGPVGMPCDDFREKMFAGCCV